MSEAVDVRGKLIQLLRTSGLYPAAVAVKKCAARLNPLAFFEQKAEMRAAVRLYSQFVRSGDLCFDVGAHQGIRTDVFLQLGARVVAVEPQEKLAHQLRQKYRRNGSVVTVAKGLAEKEGETTLYVCNYSTCSSMSKDWIDSVKDWERLKGRAWEETRTVPVTTLDRLIDEHGAPDFCKIDVEGFEWNVLKGLSRPVRGISIEYNPRHLAVVERCIDHIGGLGRYEFNYSEGDSMELASPDWVGQREMLTVVRETLPRGNVYGDIYARLGA